MKDDILKCPFCDSQTTEVYSNSNDDYYYVGCFGCDARGPESKYSSRCIEFWNRAKRLDDTTKVNNICKSCGTDKEPKSHNILGVYWMSCPECSKSSNSGDSATDAISLWNKING